MRRGEKPQEETVHLFNPAVYDLACASALGKLGSLSTCIRRYV